MADQVYYPEQIDDMAFPVAGGQTIQAANQGGSLKDVYAPTTQVNQDPPQRIIAHETVSQSIDTQSKRIKGDFSFGQQGALNIGQFQQGVSGEVKISPNGIVAKNVNGEETFTLDGATGDGTFKGVLQAGTIIGGDNSFVIEQVGQSARLVIFDNGVPSIIIGEL